MALYEDRNDIPAALVLGVCLAIGLAAGGWLVGKGLSRFKGDTRSVTVKGLVERLPARTLDKQVRDFAQQPNERFRYLVTSGLVVKTAQVDLVRAASGATEELLKAGVILDAEGVAAQSANPRFVVSKFNDLRPELFAEATKNARAIAQQFAGDSGAKVGSIRSANQGNIQILGTDGNDESAPFSPTSTPVKKIRVVSTFEFELQ